MKLLIVDDEPLAREGLRTQAARLPGITVVGESATRAGAIDAIVDRRPDVVLLDIQLGRGTAFEIIEEIGVDAMPLVIFVTAYDRHALRAFEVHAVDYLLKPVDPERFRDALDRAAGQLAQQRAGAAAGRLEKVAEALAPSQAVGRDARATAPTRLVVRDGERLVFVDLNRVEWIESAGNRLRVHSGGKSYLLRATMERIEERLAGRGDFLRVRRSALVNVRAVTAMERYAKGMYTLRLASGVTVTSSRYHQQALRDMIRNRSG
ncbi:MAG TPA: LytTR family DNA-binding domain-containing protein [Gemmatimonadales bacterium]